MKKEYKYTATGIVLGIPWGGGICTYKAMPLESNTSHALHELIKTKLEDNTLDSGFGFEQLKAAMLQITTTEIIMSGRKQYTNSDTSENKIFMLTKLTPTELDLLESSFYL